MLPIRYTTELVVGSPGLTIPLVAYLRSNALRIELWQRPPNNEALTWKAALMARWAELNATTYEAPQFPLNEAMCAAYLASHRGFLGPYYGDGAERAPAAVTR